MILLIGDKAIVKLTLTEFKSIIIETEILEI